MKWQEGLCLIVGLAERKEAPRTIVVNPRLRCERYPVAKQLIVERQSFSEESKVIQGDCMFETQGPCVGFGMDKSGVSGGWE